MKTVITEEIDGYNVVIGISEPSIDRFKTKEKIEPLLLAEPEFEQVKELSGLINKKGEVLRGALKNLKNPLLNKLPSSRAKNLKIKTECEEFIRVKEKDLYDLQVTLKQKKRDLTTGQAIYDEPKPGEVFIIDNDKNEVIKNLSAMIASAKEDKNVVAINIVDEETEDGTQIKIMAIPTEISDERGNEYFFKDVDIWKSEPVIEKLGVTKNTVVHDTFQDYAIEKKDLSQEQSEEIRLQNLSAEDKAAEMANAIESAAMTAANMRAKLEIQGDPDALVKSQEWYGAQVILINGKYA